MKQRRHKPEHIFEEKERIGRLSQIRELVFGAQDGLLVPLGVVTSVAGAFNNNHFVIVAGISEALAGAFSMATGAYLASQAERQVHAAEVEREKQAIRKYPDDEQKEMVMLFEREGMTNEDASRLTRVISRNRESFAITMIQKELGLEPEPPGTPTRDAVLVGVSYLSAAFVPLSPYFFAVGPAAIIISMAATLLALFVIGLLKGKVAMLPYLKSGLQVTIIGAGAGIGGYFLGTFLPKILNLE